MNCIAKLLGYKRVWVEELHWWGDSSGHAGKDGGYIWVKNND